MERRQVLLTSRDVEEATPAVLVVGMSDSSTCGASSLELDLSDQSLKRLERRDGIGVETLRLDNNQLQKLDNIDCYLDVWKLSVSNNQLSRYLRRYNGITNQVALL